ncbi:MAG: hypothetical protein SGI88_19690 [Candidatus Hydrogenedentes bacterium]|nr:hypothetical protein [Candidatus Hydrogenedentota bacterium]
MTESLLFIPFGRRVAVIAALTLFAQPLLALVDLVMYLMMSYSVLPTSEWLLQRLARLACTFLVLAGIFAILRSAQARLMRSEPTWLARLTEMNVILGLAVALILARIVPRSVWHYEDFGPIDRFMPIAQAITFVWLTLACMVWLWWCNCPPRRERLAAVTTLAFVGFEWFTGFLDILLPSVVFIFTPTPGQYTGMPVFSIPGSDTSAIVQLSSGFRGISQNTFSSVALRYFLIHHVVALVAAILAFIIYKIATRRAGKPTRH